MSEQYDAVLYLGPPASITLSKVPAALCTDSEFMQMRERCGAGAACPRASSV